MDLEEKIIQDLETIKKSLEPTSELFKSMEKAIEMYKQGANNPYN